MRDRPAAQARKRKERHKHDQPESEVMFAPLFPFDVGRLRRPLSRACLQTTATNGSLPPRAAGTSASCCVGSPVGTRASGGRPAGRARNGQSGASACVKNQRLRSRRSDRFGWPRRGPGRTLTGSPLCGAPRSSLRSLRSRGARRQRRSQRLTITVTARSTSSGSRPRWSSRASRGPDGRSADRR